MVQMGSLGYPGGEVRNYSRLSAGILNGRQDGYSKYGRLGRLLLRERYSRSLTFMPAPQQEVRFPFRPSDYKYTYFNWPPWYDRNKAAQSGDPEYPHTQNKVNGLQRTPSNKDYRAVTLNNIPLPTTGGHVTAEVKMPSGATGKPVIEDNRDGTVSIKYSPAEEGLHELFVKYNGEHVQGSPFKFHVDSISSGYVTAYGPGIVHGITGEPCNFTISTKDAGAGSSTLRGRLSNWFSLSTPSHCYAFCTRNPCLKGG